MLTQEQLQAKANIISWLNTDNDPYYKLIGYAGTGKTYLMQELIDFIPSNTCFVAPTHKAKKNLGLVIGDKYPLASLASLVGLVPDMNYYQDTTIKFKVRDYNSVDAFKPSDFDLIICDEAFMINKQSYDLLLSSIDEYTKILFIGDDAQLLPIGETESILNSLQCRESKLTEVKRNKGAILDVATELRNVERYKYYLYPFKSSKDNSIIRLANDKAKDRVLKSLYLQDADNSVIISYTNSKVNYYNNIIHSLLYPNSESFCIGEVMIAKTPIFKHDTLVLNNSDEIIITNVSEVLNDDIHNLRYYLIDGINGYLTNIYKVLHPESISFYERQLEQLATKKLWGRYWQLRTKFDDLSLIYSLTIHKSQGSGYNNVVYDYMSLQHSEDKQRLQYTAVTRAKNKLYII